MTTGDEDARRRFEATLAALADPRAWDGARDDGGPLERIETHGAVLLLGPDRVLKIRKAVDLGFLDFSTLERRRRFGAEECRLNRRLAAWMDHRLRAIVRTDDRPGVRVVDADAAPDDEGVVEYAVDMRRLPADGMLDRCLADGRAGEREIAALARQLAAFHAAAVRGPEIDRWSAPDEVAASHARNLEQCRVFAGAVLPAVPGDGAPLVTVETTLLDAIATWMEGETDRLAPLLARRVAAGRACEGHGDLHAGNVCLVPGAPGAVVYDAIEFDPRLRSHDVAEDLAFLGMDLDRRGHPDLADTLVHAYAEAASGESVEELLELQPGLRAHFALVRAKVTSIRAAEPLVAGAARSGLARDAERAFLHAAGYAVSNAAIVLCGLPGTGKSTVAALLAEALRAETVSSDRVRKELAGVRPDEPAGPDAYTPAMSDRTYDEVFRRGAAAVTVGRSVVSDANHPTAARRAYARGWMSSRPGLVVHLDAPLGLLEARLAARSVDADRTDASDADVAVLRRLAAAFEPPDEAEGMPVLRVDATVRPERIATAVLRRLVGTGRDPA